MYSSSIFSFEIQFTFNHKNNYATFTWFSFILVAIKSPLFFSWCCQSLPSNSDADLISGCNMFASLIIDGYGQEGCWRHWRRLECVMGECWNASWENVGMRHGGMLECVSHGRILECVIRVARLLHRKL